MTRRELISNLSDAGLLPLLPAPVTAVDGVDPLDMTIAEIWVRCGHSLSAFADRLGVTRSIAKALLVEGGFQITAEAA